MSFENYRVCEVTRVEASPFILDIHYAGKFPSVSFCYGLFEKEELVGVVTYGTPSSAPLRRGVCGDEYKDKVIELNRLCLKYNKKNEASFLVSKSIKLLPKPKIIVFLPIPVRDIADTFTGLVILSIQDLVQKGQIGKLRALSIFTGKL